MAVSSVNDLHARQSDDLPDLALDRRLVGRR
jgi:hypothetical protein